MVVGLLVVGWGGMVVVVVGMVVVVVGIRVVLKFGLDVVLLLIWAKAGATKSRILKYPMFCLSLNMGLLPTALYCHDWNREHCRIFSDKKRIRDYYGFTMTFYLVLYDIFVFIFWTFLVKCTLRTNIRQDIELGRSEN